MKKFFLVFIALIATASFSWSQSFSYEKSDPFEELTSGTLKIFQLENLNTVLFHGSLENEITIRIFDSSRKLTTTESFYLNFNDKGKPSKFLKIRYVIKVQNNVVVFFDDLVDNSPVIYRAIVDANSGKLLKKEQVYQFEKIRGTYRYKGVNVNYYVAQDSDAKNYAISVYNSQVEIIQFNEKHEEIGRGLFNSQSEEFKYLDPIDMIVTSDGKVIVGAAAGDNLYGGKNTLLFAVLEGNLLNVTLKDSEFLFISMDISGKILFNEKNNYLTLVGLNLTNREWNERIYTSFLLIFDQSTFTTLFSKGIDLPNIDKKYQEIFGEKESFNGLPQNFYINDDGTYSIIFEETFVRSTSENVYTTLGNIVVAVLDEKTHEVESYLVPKIHRVKMPISKFYLYKRKYEPQILMNGDQYKTCEFVVGKNGKYIFFNDTVENLEKIEKGRQTMVTGVSFLDAFAYSIEDGTMQRRFLFGEPDGREHKFAMFTVSDYDTKLNSFATIMITNTGRKNMSLVWINL